MLQVKHWLQQSKQKLAKIKAFKASEKQTEPVKQDQQTIKATGGDQTEPAKQPNPDWSSSVLFLVGGVVVVGGLSAFGYQKWTAPANQQTSRPGNQPNAIKSKEPAKRSEATESNQAEKNSDSFKYL